MPYIETYWDYDIKKECFKVCGEKGYVHSTDTLLSRSEEEIDNSLMDYFYIAYDVNVLRDRSSAKVVFYNNNEAVDVYSKDIIGGIPTYTPSQFLDWSENTDTQTVYLQLAYDVEHNVQAKYLANKECLPSKSIMDSFSIPTPPLFNSSIELLSDTLVFGETSFYLHFKFISNNTNYPSDTKRIAFVRDGELIRATNITLVEGEAEFNIYLSDLSAGLHTISVVFNGDEHNERTSYTAQFSVGYNISISDYTKYPFLRSSNGHLNATVLDYFGNPVSNAVNIHLKSEGSTILTRNASEGEVYFPYSSLNTIPNSLYVECGNSISDMVYITPINVNGLVIEPADAWTAKDKETNVSITADISDSEGNPIHAEGVEVYTNFTDEPIPIPFDEDNTAPNVVETIFVGTGEGNRTLYASVGSMNAGLAFNDYIQYWINANTAYNKDYTIGNGTFQELSSRFTMKVPSNGGNTQIYFPYYEGRNYEVSMKVVSASARDINFRYGERYNSGDYDGNYYPTTFKANQTIRLVRNDTHLTLYIGSGGYKQRVSLSDRGRLYIGISSNQKGNFLSFTNFKYFLQPAVEEQTEEGE